PESAPLNRVVDSSRMDELIKAKLDEADFYLVRFSCSLRHSEGHGHISRAVFRMKFTDENGGDIPVTTFDLFPVEVTQEIKRTFNLSLTPKLTLKLPNGPEVTGEGPAIGTVAEYTE